MEQISHKEFNRRKGNVRKLLENSVKGRQREQKEGTSTIIPVFRGKGGEASSPLQMGKEEEEGRKRKA